MHAKQILKKKKKMPENGQQNQSFQYSNVWMKVIWNLLSFLIIF